MCERDRNEKGELGKPNISIPRLVKLERQGKTHQGHDKLSLNRNVFGNTPSPRKCLNRGTTKLCKASSRSGDVFKLPGLSANTTMENTKWNNDRDDADNHKHEVLQKRGIMKGIHRSKERNNSNSTIIMKSTQPEKKTSLWRNKENNITDSKNGNERGDIEMTNQQKAKRVAKDAKTRWDENNCEDHSSNNNEDTEENPEEGRKASDGIAIPEPEPIPSSETQQRGYDSSDGSQRTSTESKGPVDPSCDLCLNEVDICDLSTFDFEHMTKPETGPLSDNQMNYIQYCRYFKVLPNGHILRNLNSSELLLRGHSLGKTRIKALCTALLLNSTVTTLEISEDQIDTGAMQYLVETFQDNSTIQYLFLQDNNMGRRPVKLLLEFLTLSDQLANLSLAGNRLTDTDGDILVSYISVTQNLNVLDLSYNSLEVQTAELLGKALVKNTSISNLSLRWNHMGGDAVTLFLACLTKNRAIESLDLSWNGFNQNAVTALCKALRVNNVLTTLDISSCQVTGDNFLEIIAAIKKNVALRYLCSRGNVFSCQDVLEVFQEFVKFKGELVMKELDLSDITIPTAAHLLVQKLMEEKDMMIYHGPVAGRHVRECNDEDMLASFNPVTVLMELGSLMGKTIEEFFDYIDEDSNGTLTREEIKNGLLSCDIPLPEHSMDLMIRKLDRDGDGTISLWELMDFRTAGPSARIATAREVKFDPNQRETEGSRCRKILRRMYKAREAVEEMRKWEQKQFEVRASKLNPGLLVEDESDRDNIKFPPIGDNNYANNNNNNK